MPSPAMASHGQSVVIGAGRTADGRPRPPSRIAVRIGRGVAALETHLMRQVAGWPVDEEVAIQFDAAFRLGLYLRHPTLEAVRIELRIDRAVERVGEIYPPAVAADLDHLRSPVERSARFGVRGPRHDAAETQGAGEPRLVWVGNVVLLEIARAPTGDVKKLVVDREVDVGDQRRAGLEVFERRRQAIRVRRFGGNLDNLLDRPFAAVAVPDPDGGRQVLQADDAVDETIGLGRVMGGPQLEDELVLLAEVDLLKMAALVEIPEMQLAPVFAAEQKF